MNKIYKLVWNNVRGCYVVASEFAKSNSRTMGKAVLGAVAVVSMLAGANSVYANGTVADGSEGAIIRGSDVVASGNQSTAIGIHTQSLGKASLAIGYYSLAGGNYLRNELGQYTDINGEKIENFDDVVVDPESISRDFAIALGAFTEASGYSAVALGFATKASGNASTAMGENTKASGDYSTAMGENTKASGDYSIAMGEGSTASGKGSTAWGHNTQAVGKYSTAFGENSIAYGDYSIAALGGTTGKEGVTTYYDDNGRSSIAIGEDAHAEKDKTYAIGENAIATAKDTIAFGNNALASHANSVALGTNSVTDRPNSIAVGNRQITNVAAGALTENSKDAVNGSQLFATNEAVNNNKKAIEDETKAREQGDAETLKKANDYTDESVKALIGTNAKELKNKINETNARVDRVGATAAALAAINYQPMAKGQSQIAVGMGGYKGKQATALGFAYQINNRVSGAIAGSASGEERMFNIGFSYLFGQHSNKDVAQMAIVPGSMTLKEAELKAEVDSLKADNAIIKADNAAMKADNEAMKAKMAELEAIVKALAAKQ